MNEQERIEEYIRIKNSLEKHKKAFLELSPDAQKRIKPLLDKVLKEFACPELNNLKFKSSN